MKSFVQKPFPTIEELRKNNNLLSKNLLSGKLSLKHKKMKIPLYPCDFYKLATTMQFNNIRIISITPDINDRYIYHLKLLDESNKSDNFILKPAYKDRIIPQYELSK